MPDSTPPQPPTPSPGGTIDIREANQADLAHFSNLIKDAFPAGQEYCGPLPTARTTDERGWQWPESKEMSFAQPLPFGRVKEVVKFLTESGSRHFEHVNNPVTEEKLKSETIVAKLSNRPAQ